MKNNNKQSGFTLIEVMVTIGIFGLLISIGIPRYQTFRARAQQVEAKVGLNALYLTVASYQANYNDFPSIPNGEDPITGTTKIGFALTGGVQHYQYWIVSKSFVDGGLAWAAGASSIKTVNNGNFDDWRMNANHFLCSAFDGVIGASVATQSTPVNSSVANSCPVSPSIAAPGIGGNGVYYKVTMISNTNNLGNSDFIN